MPLITGTPRGTLTAQEDLFLESAPSIWFQSDQANLLNNLDGQAYYWGLSATAQYPVIELGCIEGVSMTENLTMNDVICDTIGVKDTVQRRNYLELDLTVKSFFPLSILQYILHGGPSLLTSHVEEMGIG